MPDEPSRSKEKDAPAAVVPPDAPPLPEAPATGATTATAPVTTAAPSQTPTELAYLEANLLRAHYELQSVHLGQRELARQNVELVKRKAVLVQEAADCVKKLAEAMHVDPAVLQQRVMDAIQKREAQQVTLGASSGNLLL